MLKLKYFNSNVKKPLIFQRERTRRKSETEQLKSLNDGLVGYVNNVHELEHTIETLKTENNLLWKKCKESEPKVDIKAIFENHIKVQRFITLN